MGIDMPGIAAGLASNIVTGLVSGAFSASVAYWLAFRRFRAEKWWERRADAYGKILDALHESLRFADTHLRYDQSGKDIPPEIEADVRASSQAANSEIRRAIDVGKLFLSTAALNRLARFMREDHDNQAENWTAYLSADYELTSKCIAEFADIARADLGVPKKMSD